MRRSVASLVVTLLLAVGASAGEWRVLSPAASPSARAGLTLTNVSGRLLLYGGRDNTTPFRELWEWKPTADLQGGSWVKLTPTGPTPDSSFVHAAAAFRGKLYVVHGYSSVFQVVAGVWAYDPATNAWTAAPSTGQAPAGRWGHRVVVLQNHAYLMGGALASGQPATDVYTYNLDTGAWKKETLTGQTLPSTADVPPIGPQDLAGVGLGAVAYETALGVYDQPKLSIWGGELAGLVRDRGAFVHPTEDIYMPYALEPNLTFARRAWAVESITARQVEQIGGTTLTGVTGTTWYQPIETMLHWQAIGRGGGLGAGAPMPFPRMEGGFAQLGWFRGAPPPGPVPSSEPLRGIYFGGRDGTGTFRNHTFLYTSDQPANDYTPDLMLPAVASLRGSGGVSFRSLLWAYNSGELPVQATVLFTPRRDVGGAQRWYDLRAEPGRMIFVDNPLKQWFGFSDSDKAAGTFSIWVNGENPFWLHVQTTIVARQADGSEYGQDLRASRRNEAVPEGFTVELPTTPDIQHNRVNFAVAAWRPAAVTVTLMDRDGTPLGTPRPIALGSGESVQLNDVHKELGAAYVPDARIKMRVDSGLVQGYESVLDGQQGYKGTSDPTTVDWSWLGAKRVTMFEIGSITGLSEYKGSATVTNRSTSSHAEVQADFYERGVPGVAATRQISIPPGQARGYTDFVGDVFNLPGKVGAVVLTSRNSATISASGREYAVFRDGGGMQTGTAGQLVPGLTDEALMLPGQTYVAFPARQTGTTAGSERSHFSAFNPGATNATITLRLFNAAGQPEGERAWQVRAGELVRINYVPSAINPSQDGGEKRIEAVTTAPVFGQLFRVNKTSDPIALRVMKLAAKLLE